MPVAIEGEHLTTEVGYDAKLHWGPGSGEDFEHTDDLPWDGVWQFVQKFLTSANLQFHQLSGWLVSDNPTGEEARWGGPGLDIPAVSMPIARSLKTWDSCGIVLCDKLHILVAFYCAQNKGAPV